MTNNKVEILFKNFGKIYFQFREEIRQIMDTHNNTESRLSADYKESSRYRLAVKYQSLVPYCGDGCSEKVAKEAFALIEQYYNQMSQIEHSEKTSRTVQLFGLQHSELKDGTLYFVKRKECGSDYIIKFNFYGVLDLRRKKFMNLQLVLSPDDIISTTSYEQDIQYNTLAEQFKIEDENKCNINTQKGEIYDRNNWCIWVTENQIFDVFSHVSQHLPTNFPDIKSQHFIGKLNGEWTMKETAFTAKTISLLELPFIVQPVKEDTKQIGANRPPLGLIPLKIHNEKRHTDVRNTIIRYVEANLPLKQEWIEEYNEYL
jgi:hypothetical protein